MTKFTLTVAALLLSTSAVGAPAHSSKSPSADVVAFSETPEDAALRTTWRADFVTAGVKKRPPYDAQVRLYRAGQALPAQTISLRVRVAPEELWLRMPDLDGDGHADLVVSSTVDAVHRQPADVVFLWSSTLERFVFTRELSRIGFVYPAGAPGCVMTETTCGATSVITGQMCRPAGVSHFSAGPVLSGCEDRD